MRELKDVRVLSKNQNQNHKNCLSNSSVVIVFDHKCKESNSLVFEELNISGTGPTTIMKFLN